jgi:hypothetical protein
MFQLIGARHRFDHQTRGLRLDAYFTLAKTRNNEGNTITLRTDLGVSSALHRLRLDDVGMPHHQFPIQLQTAFIGWKPHFLRGSSRRLFDHAKGACKGIRIDTRRDHCTRISISGVSNPHPFHVLYEVEIMIAKVDANHALTQPPVAFGSGGW